MIVRMNRQGRPPAVPLTASNVARIVRASLGRHQLPRNAEINVVFVDNPVIRKLNRHFLNEKSTTDVIAFPYARPARPPKSPWPWGDIYISVPVARENARRFGDTPKTELVRLVVHGVLHLLGYRDEGAREKERMWKRQESLVRRLG